MTLISRSRSRKVNGYVKAVLALEAVRKSREDRYDRFVRRLDWKRDRLAAEVATRLRALSGGQQAAVPTCWIFLDATGAAHSGTGGGLA